MASTCFYGHDDDVLISRTSFEYFEELIKFRTHYDDLWRNFKEEVKEGREMKIEFKKRNQSELHCRFCGNTYDDECRVPRIINLFETSPITGIVCSHCRIHLEDYVEVKEGKG